MFDLFNKYLHFSCFEIADPDVKLRPRGIRQISLYGLEEESHIPPQAQTFFEKLLIG